MIVLKSYLRINRNLLLVIFLSCVIFCVIPVFLYNIFQEIVLYPILLILILYLTHFLYDFYKFKNKYNELLVLEKNINFNLTEITKENDIIKNQYQKIISLQYQENIKIFSDKKIEINNMLDYYTMWVHQIKTPILALHFLIENNDVENKVMYEVELLKIEQYVDMVLGYIRLDSENNDFVAEKVKIDDVVRKVAKKFATLFIQKKIVFDYEVSDLTVLSDKKWLEFSLEQIFSNALKYTNNKGIIKIYVQDNKLFIEDNGIGINSDNLQKLFEKGYTGFNGRKNKKSSGLGLYLTKKALDNLGHTIAIDSKLGEGTTVIISFDKYNLYKNLNSIVND